MQILQNTKYRDRAVLVPRGQRFLVIVPDESINYNIVIGYDVLSKMLYTLDENGYTFHSIIPPTERNLHKNV